MKRTFRSPAALAALGALAVSLAGCGGGASAPASAGFPQGQATQTSQTSTTNRNQPVIGKEFRSDGTSGERVAILLKGGATAANTSVLESKYGIDVQKTVPQIGLASATVPAGSSVEAVIARLKADPAVQAVEPVHAATLDVTAEDTKVNDPMVPQQYALERVNATKAWDLSMGQPSVKVALLDTGVDLNHPELKDKLLPGYNVQSPNSPPQDDYGHGTHCAGIIGAIADNGIGIVGMAPRNSIIPVKVLENGGGDDVSISAGIVWAADNGADVISMSLRIGAKSAAAEKALKYALDKNVIVVASAGNEGRMIDTKTAPRLPATYPGVITVVATDSKDQKASFSNFGPAASVSAPGVEILSTYPVGEGGATPGYTKMSGTSMACPLVAGLVSMIRGQVPGISPAEAKKRLETTADKFGKTGFDPNGLAWGRVNAFEALKGNTIFAARR